MMINKSPATLVSICLLPFFGQFVMHGNKNHRLFIRNHKNGRVTERLSVTMVTHHCEQMYAHNLRREKESSRAVV